MEFLNLSFFEFSALFALASAAIVALYLLDRSRVRIKAATLRFWQAAQIPPSQQRRRRIQQPWSLLLQLLALALLLLAASQIRWGGERYTPHNHVLIVDVSAASAAPSRADARTNVLTASKRKALAWLKTLPTQDKVSLVEAGTLLTPRTALETNRAQTIKAIQELRPTTGSARIEDAFDFAGNLQRRAGGIAGEIVYAGPARLASGEEQIGKVPENLRLLVTDTSLNNLGIRKAGVRRSLDDLGVWDVLVTIRNHAPQARPMSIGLSYGGVPVASTNATLAAGTEQTLTLTHRTKASGMLEIKLLGADDVPLDDRVELELPALPSVKAKVYTREPQVWRPLLAANTLVEATYFTPEQYTPEAADGSLLILDGITPAKPAKSPVLYVNAGDKELVLKNWSTGHPISSGIRSRDFRLAGARTLTAAAGETPVLESESGPLLLAGSGVVRLGFQPAKTAMRQEITGPLLMANIFRYLSPNSYKQWESVAASPGAIQLPVGDIETKSLQVLTGDGKALPFSVENGMLRSFMPYPGTVRILDGSREVVYSLTLPDLPDKSWDAPSTVASGIPADGISSPEAKELWRWLALAGGIILFIEWWFFAKRQRMWLKVASLAAIAIALFGPAMSLFETKLAVTILADTSQSLTQQDMDTLSQRISQVQQARGRHIVRVLPFARGVRPIGPEEATGSLKPTTGDTGRGTNLEASIRDAIASTPAGLVPHFVVVSDGMETEGNVMQALWQAQQMNIPIDTYALRGRAKPQLNIDAVKMPPQAFAGEKFPVEITLRSPREASARLELRAEGKAIGSGELKLKTGSNDLTVTAAVTTSGVIHLSGVINAGDLGEARFDQAVYIQKPRMLYISEDPAGTDSNFMKAVDSYQFEVTKQANLDLDSMRKYEVIVLNNQDLEGYSPATKLAIETYVKQGGGLLTIGGERNQYIEKKPGTPEDPLERTLPAKLAPPRSPEGTCVVLIVDKSSSMEGRKMELARIASIGVIENLRPIDLVGVLIFDNSHQWAVPIRRAEDKTLIKRLVAGITPDGGTQIAPAVAEAFKKIVPVKATFKHIVLLTDGISEEGDSIALAREAGAQRVTISTVGLGQDVNKGYLEKIAQFSKGKSYFLTDPSGLEQILLRDVMEFTGSTAVEKPAQPILMRAAEILEGTAIDKAPVLKGYVKYEAKPSADLLLTVPGEKGALQDPLLARWQYGLGRVTVFTSDAKSRWAENWMAWQGFDRFWGNVLRDLLPHSETEDSSLTFDPTNRELEVVYRLPSSEDAKTKVPSLFVFGPNEFRQPVLVQKVAAGVYRGRILIGDRTGLFRVRPAETTRLFPEVGFYRQESEVVEYGNNPELLKQLARFSGGVAEPNPGDVFRGGGRQIETSLALWPILLGLAILLNLIELFLRKGVREYFQRGGQSPALDLNPVTN
jgi:Ca-activated chloride channel family protein